MQKKAACKTNWGHYNTSPVKIQDNPINSQIIQHLCVSENRNKAAFSHICFPPERPRGFYSLPNNQVIFHINPKASRTRAVPHFSALPKETLPEHSGLRSGIARAWRIRNGSAYRPRLCLHSAPYLFRSSESSSCRFHLAFLLRSPASSRRRGYDSTAAHAHTRKIENCPLRRADRKEAHGFCPASYTLVRHSSEFPHILRNTD